MAKELSQRIADRMKNKQPSRAGRNRAAFLALRNDIKSAMDDGWPVKVIWDTLHSEEKIPFGYDAFLGYVNELIRNKPDSTSSDDSGGTDKPAADRDGSGKHAGRRKENDERKHTSPAAARGFRYSPTPDKGELI